MMGIMHHGYQLTYLGSAMMENHDQVKVDWIKKAFNNTFG